MPTKSYHSHLMESLQDPAEAAAYLESVLEDGDREHILLALKNVAEARKGSIGPLASSNWECLSQGAKSAAELPAIVALLNELGLKLSVAVRQEQVV